MSSANLDCCCLALLPTRAEGRLHSPVNGVSSGSRAPPAPGSSSSPNSPTLHSPAVSRLVAASLRCCFRPLRRLRTAYLEEGRAKGMQAGRADYAGDMATRQPPTTCRPYCLATFKHTQHRLLGRDRFSCHDHPTPQRLPWASRCSGAGAGVQGMSFRLGGLSHSHGSHMWA